MTDIDHWRGGSWIRLFGDLYLQKYRRRYHSQYGEDGLLQYVTNVLYARGVALSRTSVEFGAWDGLHLSNTRLFASAYNWRSIFIEGDAERFRSLLRTTSALPNAIAINRWVSDAGPDSLDSILSEHLENPDIDILSIDIDGDDYYILQSLIRYQPKIIVIEINFKIKPGIEDIHVKSSPFVIGKSGSSITSIRKAGERKGYALISVVGCNAVFVRKEWLGLFYDHEVDESKLFTYEGFASRELTLREKVAKKIAKYARNARRVA